MLVNNLIANFLCFNCSFVESAELVGFFRGFRTDFMENSFLECHIKIITRN